MEEWKEYELGEICTIVGRIGFRGYTTNDLTNNPEDGAITVSPTNIVGGELDLSKPTYIKWPKYYESPEIMLEQGDIILVKTGSSIGRTTRIREIIHPMTLNPQFVVLKNIKVNNIFLSYVIKSPYFQSLLKTITVGSAIPTLSQKNLAKLVVMIPTTKIQHKIASILSSIDDKIEVNRRINDNLEQQAQALFKSWFVDPQGWRLGCLSNVADIIMGSSPSGSSYNVTGDGDVFYQGRAEFSFRFPRRNMYTTEAKRYADVDSVLLSVRAPVGDINVAEERCCIGRGLASVKSNEGNSSYILYLMQSLKPVFDQFNGEGTVFGSINKKALEELKILIAPKEIRDSFEDIANKIDSEIKVLDQESRRLAELRDTLLPRLMSGELEIKE